MARILDFTDGFESSEQPAAAGGSAAEITVTPSGNLTSTNVQDALDELQADIDGAIGTPDATTMVKGKIQLAGDLGGTADSPTVPGLAAKAPLASPAFTGNPTVPNQLPANNSTRAANTAYVDDAVATLGLTKADLASPSFTGNPTVPNQTAGTNNTRAANTAYVDGAVSTSAATKVDKTTTVNGQALSGNVTVTKSDVGLSNVDNTSDANKPISDDTQDALDLKYDSSNPDNFVDAAGASAAAPVQSVAGKTGTVTLVKGDVGLSNVDNTSDMNKPVSTAQAAADATKSPLINHAFGSGESIIANSGAGELKKLVAGANVTLTPSSTNITIDLNDGSFSHDEIQMALSSGDTVETYTYKLATVTIKTLTITYTDSTRTVWTSQVWS